MRVLNFDRWRRRRKADIPESWCSTIERNVPYYRCLPEPSKRELEQLIYRFLSKKWFEGGGGFEITEEVRVTIAAQACILLLHRDAPLYPKLRTVIVYQDAYRADQTERRAAGVEVRSEQVRHGESWSHGVVVLSWDDVLSGARSPRDGENLVFHEFAHQLDHEDGAANGAPYLPHRSMYSAWAEILGREYQDLISSIARNQPTLLRRYGASNPAEFFAVITEMFFERPGDLRSEHPDLYHQLELFYEQDPASWMERCKE